MVIKLFFNNTVTEKYCEIGVRLSDVIRENVPDFVFPCSGTGKCGKCIVKCLGSLSDPTKSEIELLGDKISMGYRLACETKAIGDCSVFIPQQVELKNCAETSDAQTVEPLTADRNCLAGVVDIGTTSVAAYIYKMPEMKLIRSAIERNCQSAYGADVVSRITYAAKNGTECLSSLINNQVDSLLGDVDYKVVTGNTAMLSLYKNIDVSPLAAAPFEPKELFGFIDGKECIPKCISAFVGADVTCGILSSGMLEYENSLLIDIGTNGEIVYKNGDRLLCCSAAAGPAFEGANIRNGVQSVDGAINKVYNIGNRVEYTTIGRKKPVGLCGSGLIDAVAVMLRLGIIDNSGYLESDFYIGDSGIFITPEDIRNIQTAKAAVRGAIKTICPDIADIEKVFISGSFGSFLNVDSAVAIGLLPREFKGKVSLCGNTAASGAAMILGNKRIFEQAVSIAEKAETIQLAGNDEFFTKYISYMNF